MKKLKVKNKSKKEKALSDYAFAYAYDVSHYASFRVSAKSAAAAKRIAIEALADDRFRDVIGENGGHGSTRSRILAIHAYDEHPDAAYVAQLPYMESLDGFQRLSMFKNSLNIEFLPVEGTKVLFSKFPTTVKEYGEFVVATDRYWDTPSFPQGPDHPAVNVSWYDATAFCEWLTEKEQKEGHISQDQSYRLPYDWEWSVAVGLKEPKSGTPKSKDCKIKDMYPWGNYFPPNKDDGNYEINRKEHNFKHTSPVGSFKPNKFGLYDMGGNVREWCQDRYDEKQSYKVLRGGAWDNYTPTYLRSSCRNLDQPDGRYVSGGFRLMMVCGSKEMTS